MVGSSLFTAQLSFQAQESEGTGPSCWQRGTDCGVDGVGECTPGPESQVRFESSVQRMCGTLCWDVDTPLSPWFKKTVVYSQGGR